MDGFELAKNLVEAGRKKKLIESRCLAAYDSSGNQIISDEEIFKLAVDITAIVEIFVDAGIAFSEGREYK
jgi:hypothetical protein